MREQQAMTFLYKSEEVRGQHWKAVFAEREPDLPFLIWPERGDPEKVRYIAAWLPPDDLATAYPNLEVLFSVGAGVDQLDLTQVPPHVKVVRMVDPGVPEMMSEYVTTAVMALHCDVLAHRGSQTRREWSPMPPRPASGRRIGIMGLGRLGARSCQKLAGLGFDVSGWSRTRHEIEGIETFAGEDGFGAFLGKSEILVCLLPLTEETQGILGDALFAQLPKGAMVVNAGRGGHLDEAALVAALDSGHLAGAVLDVTIQEPLPPESPLWSHPGIFITPHIASFAEAGTSVEVILGNIARLRAGEEPIGLVDRGRGY
jgi:glyoxylate/hydroxypyruvate reductase A